MMEDDKIENMERDKWYSEKFIINMTAQVDDYRSY